MPTKYGTSVLYGAAGTYGAFSAELLAAQELRSRETGLKISIIDENLNQWVKLTGTEIRQKDFVTGGPVTSILSQSYRAQSSALLLGNGNIIRARVGDGSESDRQLYVQTITDPTLAAQWNSWSLLYSGDHIAVAVVATGASTYTIYHSKSDGSVYRDNALVWNPTADCVTIYPVEGGTNGMMYLRLLKTSNHGGRTLDLYYTENINSVTPASDILNYEWYRTTIWGYIINSKLYRLQSIGMFSDPRAKSRGDSIVISYLPSTTYGATTRPEPLSLIRGVGSDWGHNELNYPRMFLLSDGYWYLFSNEHHVDENYQLISDTYSPLIWQRSKDLYHWSEPVHTGISGLHGWYVFESGSYVYLVGNSEVWYRPLSSVTYDLTNFVPEVNMEMPSDNQVGNGEYTVSNPLGVNDNILSLSDRRTKIQVGIKTTTGQFEFFDFNDWWVRRITRSIEGESSRLRVQVGDVWDRLSNSLRDTYNFLGKTLWEDWADGKRNKSFNYFFETDSAPLETTDYRLQSRGICLYTGWKGHNPNIEVTLSGVTGTPTVIFRYVNSLNYMKVYISGSTIFLAQVKNGVSTNLDSTSITSTSNHKIKVDIVYGAYKIYYNDDLKLDSKLVDPEHVKPGYVGFNATSYKISNFTLTDWEANLTMEDLIRTALSMGDYHDVVVGNAESKAYAIIWGPQTDIPSPAVALKTALETEKLQMIWKNGFIQIGRFTDKTPVKKIQDRIISTEHTDEANRRINLAVVDGNEHTWIEVDEVDTQSRDRQIVGYYDLPELLDWDSVKDRTREEIRRGQIGVAPGGTVILFFDLNRMDAIEWVDNLGNTTIVRIEGMSIRINQSKEPRQLLTLDNSLIP